MKRCLALLILGFPGLAPAEKARTRAYFGTLSHIPLPSPTELKRLTARVLDNYRAEVVRRALLPPRPDRKPVPVPEHSGEPGVFEHVIYLIRENRTYDQVPGDMTEGNGKKDLCIFGEKITPNVHKLAREFVLLDNTYCSGILSADGHNWSLSAFANEYLNRILWHAMKGPEAPYPIRATVPVDRRGDEDD